ncbi:MAG: formylglycine-generating enzyme family protein [Ignavibacteriaceae bacterium]|nr:MAG: formylglycine-generating enzyme family protein [Ignavibacteriaceae bacterium]MBW7874337.1 formylglycine-generating enzyme family protein [Ignavibacteria bacterium]
MKALHPDRESRFAGAQEMLEELNKLEEMGATVVESIKGKISLAVVMNKTKIKTRRILSLKFKNFLNQLIRPRKKGAGSRLHRAANIVKFSLLAGLLLVAFFLIKSLTSGEILHEMVFVKGGTYLMGCTPDQEPECNESTNPAKTVSVNDFYISKYEVTQELWESVMDFNPSKYEGKNLPVEGVSWLYAVEFCNWLSDKEGLERAYSGGSMNISCNFQANGYRLPTEAEWEYAARGGLRSGNYKYSGSSDIEKIAWYKKNSNKVSHPVGRMLPNELGLYDMSGNIWEWCWDNCMDLGSKTSDTNNNSQLAWILNYRALRGGDWSRQGSDCRVSARGCNHYTSKGTNIGFRLVRSK